MQQGIIIILTSVSSEKEGKTLATGLVEAGLAACVQISAAGLSIYSWNEAIQQEREYYLSIKTSDDAASAAVDWLQSHHPYDTPEIVQLDGAASLSYMQWLLGHTA